MSTRITRLALATVAACFTITGAAQAACPATPLSQPFKQFGDSAYYTLAPGAGFESGMAAWTLNGSGGELLAYCVAMRGASEMHLLNITVAASARRQGHARRLLDALVDECRDVQAERLWLEVRLANVEAQRTYLRLGFTKVGVRKGYYPAPGGTREDAVVMNRIIEPIAGSADALE